MTSPIQPRLIFVTGTDTGVGKTVLTSLLLCHLRAAGCPALAIKPFCSGGRADAELLCALQDGALTLDEINPFHFVEPVAPLVAARKHRRKIALEDVLARIRSVAAAAALGINPAIQQSSNPSLRQSVTAPPVLLIEGAGGLLAPLGEDFSALDLFIALRCEVFVVSRNRLGAINHTLLAVRALAQTAFRAPRRSRPTAKVVLMNPRTGDCSSASNSLILTELLAPVPLVAVPFLGRNCTTATAIRKSAKKLGKTLGQILS